MTLTYEQLEKISPGYYSRFFETLKNWQVDVTKGGTVIVKKGSWRVNRNLWKPHFYVPHKGKFPEGIPQYVQKWVRLAEKKVK